MVEKQLYVNLCSKQSKINCNMVPQLEEMNTYYELNTQQHGTCWTTFSHVMSSKMRACLWCESQIVSPHHIKIITQTSASHAYIISVDVLCVCPDSCVQ